jgi:hypothetical protein
MTLKDYGVKGRRGEHTRKNEKSAEISPSRGKQDFTGPPGLFRRKIDGSVVAPDDFLRDFITRI